MDDLITFARVARQVQQVSMKPLEETFSALARHKIFIIRVI